MTSTVSTMGAVSRGFDEYCTPPRRIRERTFHEMLGVLPPEDLQFSKGAVSFKLSEYYTGPITSIYATVGRKCYTFKDYGSITHDEIVTRIKGMFPDSA